jgi:hypothetical protein
VNGSKWPSLVFLTTASPVPSKTVKQDNPASGVCYSLT